MPRMTVPLGADQPTVPLLVGLSGKEMSRRIGAGLPVTPPVLIQAVIDTGANVSNVSPAVIRRLGIGSTGWASNQTAGGSIQVDLYEVSIGLPPLFGIPSTLILEDTLTVGEIPVALPDVDFLLGVDVLRRCVLTLNGPANTVSLDV